MNSDLGNQADGEGPSATYQRELERQKWFDEHVATFEHMWAVWPYIADAPRSLGRLSAFAQHRTNDRRYYSCGRVRCTETHCVFQYTIKGNGYFRDAKGEHRVGPGQGFLCAIDDEQTSYYYGNGDGEDWQFFSICLEGENARAAVGELVETRGPIFKVPLEAPIWRQLQSLRTEQYSMPHLSLMTLVELASMLLVVLWQSDKRALHEPTNELVKKALHRLSLPSPLPEVRALANSLSISREHLSRVFHQQMGISPQNWIHQERINRACRLLCASDASNKQIAFQLGYEQTSSFVRAFTRTMNLTPQQFRQRAQHTPTPDGDST